ncbi:MAG: homogentisate 1,2-dioxygenase [Rhodospirillales bacterium]|nr:homogentisate 1,2-dioxygenase [Rhodospirillales bacterium]
MSSPQHLRPPVVRTFIARPQGWAGSHDQAPSNVTMLSAATMSRLVPALVFHLEPRWMIEDARFPRPGFHRRVMNGYADLVHAKVMRKEKDGHIDASGSNAVTTGSVIDVPWHHKRLTAR